MQEFIVLGQIPGTQVQVSFDVWLYAVASLCVFTLFHVTWRELMTRWDIHRANEQTASVFNAILTYRSI